MKRHTILGGLAALVLAAFSVAIPGTASATVTCNDVDASTSYPHGHYTQYCGTATQANAQKVYSAAAGAPGSALGELRTSFQPVTTPATPPGVQFYLFHTPAEYAQNFPAAGGNPVPANTDFAVTKFDSAGRPIFSAIFEVNGAGTTNAFVQNSAAHEVGRSIDALMGYVMNGGVPRTPYPQVSVSTGNGLFLDQLNADWTALNLLPPCTSTGSGVFNGQADPTKPPTAYICNGTNGNGASRNAAYATMSNKQILQAIWPNYASADKLIAEEYGYYALGAIGDRSAAPFSQDIYIKPTGPQFQFACSTTLITYVGQHGTIPTHTNGTADNLPSACPTIAASATTTCIKVFTTTTNGHFPDGRVMDCNPQPNSISSGLAGTLTQLGGASLGVKQRLENAASFVFVWKTANGQTAEQRYKAAFTKAGVDLSGTTFNDNGTIVNGWSAPFGTNAALPPLWYTLMNADSPGLQQFGSLSANLLAYVTGHELGHVIDFNLDVPQPSASVPSADFDRAVQNDYLYLDYTVYPTKRKPCATVGSLGYNGPFLNVSAPTGPNTTVPVCDGKATGDFGTAFETAFSQQFPNGTLNHLLLWAFINEGPWNVNPQSGTIGGKPALAISPGWREWFAQMFARSANINLQVTSNRPAFETILLNGVQVLGGVQQGGYMGCTAGINTNNEYDGYLHRVYTTGSGKAGANTILSQLPARCKPTLPAGWVDVRN